MKYTTLLALALVSSCSATTDAPAPAPIPAPAPPEPVDLVALEGEVWETELAFAETMALRDHEAFTSFLSEEAIFFSSSATFRGRAQVAAGWAVLFETPDAPFSWEPDDVEVLASGTLALSTGPVLSPTGSPVGRFNSIWRLEEDGWRVVFDKGEGD